MCCLFVLGSLLLPRPGKGPRDESKHARGRRLQEMRSITDNRLTLPWWPGSLACTCCPRWPCVFQLAQVFSWDRHGWDSLSLQQVRYLLCYPSHSFLQRISTVSRPDAVEERRRCVQCVPREEGANEELGSREPGLKVFTSCSSDDSGRLDRVYSPQPGWHLPCCVCPRLRWIGLW